jgi:flagellar basal-body rod modification protein FlgD
MVPVSNTPTDQTQQTGANSSTGSGNGTSSVNGLTNESTFLQLLVAQIKNQDPLNPTDSIQFVSQLVSFSQLEQLLNINQNLQTLVGDSTPPKSSSTSGNQN